MSAFLDDSDQDHYEVLGVPYDASAKDIGRAYRLAALKCHPDKVDPNDEEAAALFLRLTKAYDVLSDPEKRSTYDGLLKAKLAKKAKMAKLDAGRRAMASELEKRENYAREKKYEEAAEVARLKAEIERLREDGLARIAKKEEEARQREKEARERAALAALVSENPEDPTGTKDIDRTLRLRWKLRDFIMEIDEMFLRSLLAPFGLISHLLLTKPKKEGKKAAAVAQFAHLGSAMDALEAGRAVKSPWPRGLEVDWAVGEEPLGCETIRKARQKKAEEKERHQRPKSKTPVLLPTTEPFGGFPAFSFQAPATNLDDEDYEAATLRKMRERAEARERERKRLLEEEEEQGNGIGTAEEEQRAKKAKLDNGADGELVGDAVA